MLSNREITIAGLGILAAETARNQDNIGLVGLVENGFHFEI
jgi:hypothetical protein